MSDKPYKPLLRRSMLLKDDDPYQLPPSLIKKKSLSPSSPQLVAEPDPKYAETRSAFESFLLDLPLNAKQSIIEEEKWHQRCPCLLCNTKITKS